MSKKWRACSWDCFLPVWTFWTSVTWGFSTGRIVAFSQCRNRIPSSHHSNDLRQERFIVGGELTKFSADAYALLHLVSCQDPWHRFGCDTLHAQFFRQNTLASTITNVHLLSNVRNGPTSILANDLLNSCNGFRSCATCGSPGVSSSSTDVRPALNRACHWNTSVRFKLWSQNPCWIISRVSVALFPRFSQNLGKSVPFSYPLPNPPRVTYTTPHKRSYKLTTPSHLRDTWQSDLLKMVVLPSTGAWR